MKPILHFCLLLLLLGCEPVEISDYNGESDISIMSFNLRYDEPADGDNQWGNRKQACISMLSEMKPSVFGIQEGLHHQVSFIDEHLPDYNYVGVGRDDGHSSGEYSAIFYSTEHFELLKSGNFWLSETPETPSLGWDANNIRIVTWIQLKDIEKHQTVYVFNTHFDHKGKTARLKSSQLLVQKIQEIAEENAPVFITGDFNMLIGNAKLAPITSNYFSAQRFAEKSDDNQSFNAFGTWILSRNIDFIFYQNARALSYKTIVKNYGVPYISDHYPIISHFDYQ
ncbi:endonuclease/exonuclease/phosphatase family protein [Rapidithrix thailandica]|uniref:Endonuclease/exonuclease/phosphatase family protein n=1 Tax=Rapidithrix thailandica TaxID=413964 RepID=A0AAW9SKZ3_9BACT